MRKNQVFLGVLDGNLCAFSVEHIVGVGNDYRLICVGKTVFFCYTVVTKEHMNHVVAGLKLWHKIELFGSAAKARMGWKYLMSNNPTIARMIFRIRFAVMSNENFQSFYVRYLIAKEENFFAPRLWSAIQHEAEIIKNKLLL